MWRSIFVVILTLGTVDTVGAEDIDRVPYC